LPDQCGRKVENRTFTLKKIQQPEGLIVETNKKSDIHTFNACLDASNLHQFTWKRVRIWAI